MINLYEPTVFSGDALDLDRRIDRRDHYIGQAREPWPKLFGLGGVALANPHDIVWCHPVWPATSRIRIMTFRDLRRPTLTANS